MLRKADPTSTEAWKLLAEHYRQVKDLHMKDLFAGDPDRFSRYSIGFNDILVDYSKNRITGDTGPKVSVLTTFISGSTWSMTVGE